MPSGMSRIECNKHIFVPSCMMVGQLMVSSLGFAVPEYEIIAKIVDQARISETPFLIHATRSTCSLFRIQQYGLITHCSLQSPFKYARCISRKILALICKAFYSNKYTETLFNVVESIRFEYSSKSLSACLPMLGRNRRKHGCSCVSDPQGEAI